MALSERRAGHGDGKVFQAADGRWSEPACDSRVLSALVGASVPCFSLPETVTSFAALLIRRASPRVSARNWGDRDSY
jgi:hypothetical protein